MSNKKQLTDNQMKEINSKLGTIVLMREEICETVNRDCLICPLSIGDKCTELNLGEFDYKENQWLDIEIKEEE